MPDATSRCLLRCSIALAVRASGRHGIGIAAEPAGQAPGRKLSGRSGSCLGSRSSWSPASPWSRTRSPSSGEPTASSGSSRWATIRSASTARASPAASSGSWKTPTATADTTRRPTFLDGLGFPDRRHALARGRAGRVRSRHLLCRGPRRRRQGRPSRGAVHRLRRGKPAASPERLRAGPRRLGLRRQRRQRRHGSARVKTGQGHVDQRPRFPVPARYRRVRGRERPDPVRPAPRRLGPLVRQQQPQLGLALRPRRITTSAATRRSPRPTRGKRSSPTPGFTRSAAPLPRFNDPGAANHVTSANSPTPYRDDLFGPEFATSLFVSEPVHNLVHRMVLEPDGADLSRPARGRTKRSASSSRRATTGFGPRCSRPAPTARSGSPTCTARSSSIPNGFPTTGKSGSTSARAASRGGSIASIRSTRSRGRFRGSTSSTPPGSWPRSTAPAAGSATPPSAAAAPA